MDKEKKKDIGTYKMTYQEKVLNMALSEMPRVNYRGVDIKDLVCHKMLEIDSKLEHKFKSVEDINIVNVLTEADIVNLIFAMRKY